MTEPFPRATHFVDLDGITKPVSEQDDDRPPQFTARVGGATIFGERRTDEYRRALLTERRAFDQWLREWHMGAGK